MPKRVNIDAMIRREDFGIEVPGDSTPDTVRELNLQSLLPNSPIRRQLRKPDFQRETNHWEPEQVVNFLTSFIDNNVIPGIILWRSSSFIFVLDGAHRLSALCAWIENDYGDGPKSREFYNDVITREQKRIAEKTRRLVNQTIGSFESLEALVGKASEGVTGRRAGSMFVRPINLQTVVGDARVAEDSFFAINSQGTPLDDTETMLIKNRRKPVAIGARAIVRAGTGHPYWSRFSQANQTDVKRLAANLNHIIFEPEAATPIKTIDLPLGGSSSPVDALAVLIDFLTVCNSGSVEALENASAYQDDDSGEETIKVLREGLRVANRITGNSAGSLGLHPAVYFANDKGKHSRFLFLGMVALVAAKIRNNDDGWFRKFTIGRKGIEKFLLENKSAIGVVLQNLSKGMRIPKMRDMFDFIITAASKGEELTFSEVFKGIGISGKVYDLGITETRNIFSDDTKAQIVVREALRHTQTCPICGGLLDVGKSVSFDHITPIREGGLGTAQNGQLVHPYCNTGMKG